MHQYRLGVANNANCITWKRFVNKFERYVMYRSVYFSIFAFYEQKNNMLACTFVNCEFLP